MSKFKGRMLQGSPPKAPTRDRAEIEKEFSNLVLMLGSHELNIIRANAQKAGIAARVDELEQEIARLPKIEVNDAPKAD